MTLGYETNLFEYRCLKNKLHMNFIYYIIHYIYYIHKELQYGGVARQCVIAATFNILFLPPY